MADDNSDHKVTRLSDFQASRQAPVRPFSDAEMDALLEAFPFLIDDRQQIKYPFCAPASGTLGL